MNTCADKLPFAVTRQIYRLGLFHIYFMAEKKIHASGASRERTRRVHPKGPF